MRRSVIALVFAVALAGCGGARSTSPTSPLAADLKDAPEWVRGDCRSALPSTSAICGVGALTGTNNPALAKAGAEARARTSIARSIASEVSAMIKDYQSSTTGGDQFGKHAADEQMVVDVAKQVSQETLKGSHVVANWIAPSGTYYALVYLDTEGFLQELGRLQTLDEQVRKAIEERAQKAFDELGQAAPVEEAVAAADQAEPDAAVTQHWEDGKVAYRVGDFATAIAEWKEAYKVSKNVAFLYNIAQAYREAKDFEKAVFFYEQYLHEDPQAANRTIVEQKLANLRVALAAIPPS